MPNPLESYISFIISAGSLGASVARFAAGTADRDLREEHFLAGELWLMRAIERFEVSEHGWWIREPSTYAQECHLGMAAR